MRIVKKFKGGVQIGQKGKKYYILGRHGEDLEEGLDFTNLKYAIDFVDEEHVDEHYGEKPSFLRY